MKIPGQNWMWAAAALCISKKRVSEKQRQLDTV